MTTENPTNTNNPQLKQTTSPDVLDVALNVATAVAPGGTAAKVALTAATNIAGSGEGSSELQKPKAPTVGKGFNLGGILKGPLAMLPAIGSMKGFINQLTHGDDLTDLLVSASYLKSSVHNFTHSVFGGAGKGNDVLAGLRVQAMNQEVTHHGGHQH